MNGTLTSVNQLLLSEWLFEIPIYQRGYAWEQDNLRDLWDDLYYLGDREHYFGTMTLLATLQHRTVADAGSGSSRRLRHHMPDPAVTHLRDRALPPHAPARLLAWHQPDVGHQLAR